MGSERNFSAMRLLLLSNSKNVGQGYLEHAAPELRQFLTGVRTALFVPFAAVRVSWDDFTASVRAKFGELGVAIDGIHAAPDPAAAVRTAEAIVVGGGNTFQLLKAMHECGLVTAIAERVRAGAPFVGWSAGSNVACPTIRTTNDMPIVEPPTLRAMGLVPFQINPHYLDTHPSGHGGETREERILEFIAANPDVDVVGLREGSLLRLDGERLELLGPKPARIFRSGREAREVEPGPVQFLMR
jgi:dipeptidase E